MADNVEEILEEIRARKKAKKYGVVRGGDVGNKAHSVNVNNLTLVKVDVHRDLNEIMLRVEGKK